MSSLLIYRHTKSSNSVSDYKSNLSGEELDKFNSYSVVIKTLLETYSGSFYKKDHGNFYDVVYKFDDSQNALSFYADLESANACNEILEYKNSKINENNEVVSRIKIIFRDVSANTSATLKTINL